MVQQIKIDPQKGECRTQKNEVQKASKTIDSKYD